jgi:hypothetical protein
MLFITFLKSISWLGPLRGPKQQTPHQKRTVFSLRNFLRLNLKVQPQETEHKMPTSVSAKHNTKKCYLLVPTIEVSHDQSREDPLKYTPAVRVITMPHL